MNEQQTTTTTATTQTNTQTNQPVHHPKARPSASCIPCRNRKVKCNRLHPCTTCISRNTPTECHYTATDVDREAMKNAEDIAALRSKVRTLRGSVGVTHGPGYNSGSGAGAGAGYGSGSGSGGYAGPASEEMDMEIVYAALKNADGEVVDGIVKMVRAGVEIREIARFVRSLDYDG